ncbi:Rhamnogalacturonate lyase, partial [Linum perenne]
MKKISARALFCRLNWAFFFLVTTAVAAVAVKTSVRGSPGSNNSSAIRLVHRRDSRTVTIDNGIVQVTFLSPDGHVIGIKYEDIDNVLETSNLYDRRGYWDVVWNKPGVHNSFDKLPAKDFRVVKHDEDQIEISFSKKWKPEDDVSVPLNVDKRYILRKGSAGIYMYTILERMEGWPDVDMDQIRVVFRPAEKLFHFMAISDGRQRVMPTEEDVTNAQRLAYKEAVLLTNPSNPELRGEVDDKYQYSCEDKDNKVHGWISEKRRVGFWMITPSDEFRVGGPIKQDLTSHVGPITLNMFTSTHYAGKDLNTAYRNGEPWKKVFGPVLVYLNAGEPSTLWPDAKKRMHKEVKSWPYDFVNSEDFPTALQRGTVVGRLLVRDRYTSNGFMSAGSAYVGLAMPGKAGSWQTDGKGYQFWTRADEKGRFSIETIREGIYSLYGWVPGIIGDYKYKVDITISPGSKIKLGNIVFDPPRNGPTLWDIGVPDRTAAEFHVPDAYPTLMNKLYANHQRFRQYGLWSRYAEMYPKHDLVYEVGVSNFFQDWFYAHVPRSVGNNTFRATTWQIKFDLPKVDTSGDYTLQLALASAADAELVVRFNDRNPRRKPVFTTGLIGKDNAIARHGIHGLHWLFSLWYTVVALFILKFHSRELSTMPLLKNMPFPLLEPPEDLKPKDRVYQVRCTKEIFRDYRLFSSMWIREYVNRINFYRQRIWTCKISGKENLTYEEALVSEKLATEKVEEIPKELVEPALRLIQFSMLSLKDLVATVRAKLQEYKFVGDELHARKGESVFPCKILKILEDSNGKTCYEIEWLERSKEVTGISVVNGFDLIRKKKLFSRHILKSFIRESTYRRDPWVLHDQLAEKHGISNNQPEELKDSVFILNGVICDKKRKSVGDVEEIGNCKKRKGGSEVEVTDVAKNNGTEVKQVVPIKYPIDDLLVQPAASDPVFTERPLPSRDFKVPVDCVGDLLLVWDYCSSFGRLLHLSPFPLEDFENAICRKDYNLILIVEIHSAFLRLLLKENGDRFFSAKRRTAKSKITLNNWTEYLCDFIGKTDHPGLSASTSTIKRGHYGHLDIQVKLGILHELVNEAVQSVDFRKKMDDVVEQRQILASTFREEALEEGRKRREEKERSKIVNVANGVSNGHCLVDPDGLQCNQDASVNGNSNENGGFLRRHNSGSFSSEENHTSDRSDNDHSKTASKNVETETGKGTNASKQGARSTERRSAYQRVVYPILPALCIKYSWEPTLREHYNREMEKLVLRTEPLGKDRHYQRYWWFQHDGRIFVESSDCKEWGFYSSKEELNALMGSLNRKGERELALHSQLEKWHSKIRVQMEKKSKELALETARNEGILRRSTRVQSMPSESPAELCPKPRYVNKWKLKKSSFGDKIRYQDHSQDLGKCPDRDTRSK